MPLSRCSTLVNILMPIPVNASLLGLGTQGSLGGLLGLGGLNSLGGLGNLGGLGLPRFGYYGYFTRYLGPARINGSCPNGENINGQCWYNIIDEKKR
ncbi:unnamed protein product [Gongylonema pulchrum]|uniref:Uncharacterized protein n=1 Tax=Gongylonema pulchrum TaxID=637853 RepID=A0A183D5T4_9BILA|nr:unnamed protein product [Gongylonema pulchrum]